ncbi:MAG: dockerin type I repeat-containing protein [Candidatus Omnitrophica bacterium]|nr:dockerin type I repeat-containing protein [Candidatus Omnitrophota bacterium]
MNVKASNVESFKNVEGHIVLGGTPNVHAIEGTRVIGGSCVIGGRPNERVIVGGVWNPGTLNVLTHDTSSGDTPVDVTVKLPSKIPPATKITSYSGLKVPSEKKTGPNLLGDANKDGETNVMDIVYTELIIAGEKPFTVLADVNLDGTIDEQDVQKIGSMILGKESIPTLDEQILAAGEYEGIPIIPTEEGYTILYVFSAISSTGYPGSTFETKIFDNSEDALNFIAARTDESNPDLRIPLRYLPPGDYEDFKIEHYKGFVIRYKDLSNVVVISHPANLPKPTGALGGISPGTGSMEEAEAYIDEHALVTGPSEEIVGILKVGEYKKFPITLTDEGCKITFNIGSSLETRTFDNPMKAIAFIDSNSDKSNTILPVSYAPSEWQKSRCEWETYKGFSIAIAKEDFHSDLQPSGNVKQGMAQVYFRKHGDGPRDIYSSVFMDSVEEYIDQRVWIEPPQP